MRATTQAALGNISDHSPNELVVISVLFFSRRRLINSKSRYRPGWHWWQIAESPTSSTQSAYHARQMPN